MTVAQKTNIARFKAVQAEAKKLKSKNKNLTHIQAVKQAWAILYSKEKKASPKKKVTKKAAPKKKVVKKVAPKKKVAKKVVPKKLKYVGVKKTASGASRYEYKLAGIGSVIYGIISGSKYSQLAQQLILQNIDSSDYNVSIKTDLDKIKFLKKTFLDEYGWAVSRMGLQNAVESWLRGLPSSLSLPFYNDEIIEIAKQWGSLPINATEKQEDKILNNYWKLMAANVVKLFKKV